MMLARNLVLTIYIVVTASLDITGTLPETNLVAAIMGSESSEEMALLTEGLKQVLNAANPPSPDMKAITTPAMAIRELVTSLISVGHKLGYFHGCNPWYRDNQHPRNTNIRRLTAPPPQTIPEGHEVVIERWQMSRWVDSVATAVENLPGTCLEWEPGIFAKSIPACAGGTIHHFYYNGVREGEAPDAHVLRGDLTRPDFVKQNEKQGAYDVILCMQVFEHLSGCPMTAMKNLYTMLKKKGVLLWSAPHVSIVHGDPSDFWRYTPDGARLLSERAGFEVASLWAPGGRLVSAIPVRFCIALQLDECVLTELALTLPGASLLAGQILGAHVDYWRESDFLASDSDADWPIASYMFLRKPTTLSSGNERSPETALSKIETCKFKGKTVPPPRHPVLVGRACYAANKSHSFCADARCGATAYSETNPREACAGLLADDFTACIGNITGSLNDQIKSMVEVGFILQFKVAFFDGDTRKFVIDGDGVEKSADIRVMLTVLDMFWARNSRHERDLLIGALATKVRNVGFAKPDADYLGFATATVQDILEADHGDLFSYGTFGAPHHPHLSSVQSIIAISGCPYQVAQEAAASISRPASAEEGHDSWTVCGLGIELSAVASALWLEEALASSGNGVTASTIRAFMVGRVGYPHPHPESNDSRAFWPWPNWLNVTTLNGLAAAPQAGAAMGDLCDLLVVVRQPYWSFDDIGVAAAALLKPGRAGALLVTSLGVHDNEPIDAPLSSLGWKKEIPSEVHPDPCGTCPSSHFYLSPPSFPRPVFVTAACDGNWVSDGSIGAFPPTSRLVRTLVGSLLASLRGGSAREDAVILVVFADQIARDHLQKPLAELSALTQAPAWHGPPLEVEVRDLVLPPAWSRLNDGLLCSATRLHLPSLLPNLQAAVWVDADVVFSLRGAALDLRSAAWPSSHQLVSGVLEHGCESSEAWYSNPKALNAGVLGMNLEAMRKVGWENTVERELKDGNNVYGDQDILNSALASFPTNMTGILPCHFNWRPDFCYYTTYDCVRCDSSPSVLHGSRAAFIGKEASDFFPIRPFQLVFSALEQLTLQVSEAHTINDSAAKAAFELQSQWETEKGDQVPCASRGSEIVSAVATMLDAKDDPALGMYHANITGEDLNGEQQPASSIHEAMSGEGSDKAQHGFSAVYDVELGHLRGAPGLKLLEFGVFQGASLRAWAAFFTGAERRIIGLDNFLGKMGWSFPDGSPLTFANPLRVLKDQQFGRLPAGAEVLIVDQGEREELAKAAKSLLHRFGPTLDIIVDDGSHLMKDQQHTLGIFWPLLREGGVFVMEDVHSSRQDGYDVQYLSVSNGDTCKNDWWTLLENYEEKGAIESFYMTPDEALYIAETLGDIRCYILKEAESETCILRKGPHQSSDELTRKIHYIHGEEVGISSRILYGG